MPISPTLLHKRGHSLLSRRPVRGCEGWGFGGKAVERRSSGGVLIVRAPRPPFLRAQGSSGGTGAFALCAMEGFDRFQCLLRHGSRCRWV